MEELSNAGIFYYDNMAMNNKDRPVTDFESSYWENSDLGEQFVYNEDGFVNLSSIDLNLFTIYEYDAGNKSSEIKHNVISTSRTVVLSIFAVIFVVGLIGNALVIYTVSRYITMRRVTYLYLLNLSVADIMYLLVCLPTLSASYALVDWRFGRFFCKLQNYVMAVSMSVSVLTIVATGLDRYIAVIYPLAARNYRTVKRAVFVISLTWILSLAVMALRIPLFDEVSVWHITGVTTLCSRIHTDTVLRIDSSLNCVFMYLLPLLVLCICHARIGKRLWTSKRPGNTPACNSQMRMLLVHHKRRIAKMILVVTIIFAIGWLPIHVYHLVEDFDKGHILMGKTVDRGMIALFFSFGANTLNPIIYCMFSSNFRKHFIKALRCWKPRIITSINGEDLGYFRNPATFEMQQEHPRPPPVLLPRPASLMADSASYLDTDSIYIGKATYLASATILSLQPLLHRRPEFCSSCSEPSSNCSPLSVKRVAHVEINSCQLTSGSTCQREEDETPLLSLPPRDTAQDESTDAGCTDAGCSNDNLQTQVFTSRTRRADSFSNSQRFQSGDCYRCDKEMPGTSKSLQENLTTPDDDFNGSQTTNSYDNDNSCDRTEAHSGDDKISTYEQYKRQDSFTSEDLTPDTFCDNSALSVSSGNTAVTAKHTSIKIIESPIKMVSAAHTDNPKERLVNFPGNQKQFGNRTPLASSDSKLLQRKNVFTINKPTTSRLNADTSMDKPTHSSLLPSPRYHSAVQERASKEIHYVGCKYKDKTAQIETDQDDLPPVD